MLARGFRSLRVRIAEAYKEDIASQVIYHGMPAASAHDLAERYGISLPTAHHVLNLLVKEGLLYRVRGSGTFFNRDRVDRQLNICIADQSISPEYLSPEINAIMDSHIDFASAFFKRHGCSVRVLSYRELLKQNGLKEVSGLLVSSMFMDETTAEILKKLGIPVVVYRYSHTDGFRFSKVGYDLDLGMRQAVEHLALTGKEQVIVVTETTPSGEHAKRHWLRNLAERCPSVTCFDMDVSERELCCYRMVRVHEALFRQAIVLAGNDDIAVSIANALTLEGIDLGRECRVVGVGDMAGGGASGASRLQVSSVTIPRRLMAEEAAQLLLYQMDHGGSCIHDISVPTGFVARGSSASKP